VSSTSIDARSPRRHVATHRLIVRTLAALAPAALLGAAPISAAPGSAAVVGRRILVVGLDAADWQAIDPLVKAGRLPVFARLERRIFPGLRRPARPAWRGVIRSRRAA
jgi:hypothetical protein